jgi:hypothetical protein
MGYPNDPGDLESWDEDKLLAEHRELLATVDHFTARIADLRSRAAPAQRDTYTVVLGQLHAVGLIDEPTWQHALSL